MGGRPRRTVERGPSPPWLGGRCVLVRAVSEPPGAGRSRRLAENAPALIRAFRDAEEDDRPGGGGVIRQARESLPIIGWTRSRCLLLAWQGGGEDEEGGAGRREHRTGELAGCVSYEPEARVAVSWASVSPVLGSALEIPVLWCRIPAFSLARGCAGHLEDMCSDWSIPSLLRDSTDLIDSIDSIDSNHSTHSIDSTHSTDSIDSIDPIDPT